MIRPACPRGSKTDREVRAGLCGQGLVPGGFPVPGQEFVHTGRVRQLGDAGEDIGEPGLRVTSLSLAVTMRVYIAEARSPPRSAAEHPTVFPEQSGLNGPSVHIWTS